MTTDTNQGKRLAPLSLRLTREERAWLERAATGRSLGSYIKARLFTDESVSADGRQLPVRDQRTVAKMLAQIGRSELAASLRDLADAARSGSLECDPDVQTALLSGCADIQFIRSMLVAALGLKVYAPPHRSPLHAEHFLSLSTSASAHDPQGITARRGQSACRPSA